ncbi:uncharacterized protein NPIL_639691, partial [Nephila pilipes]
MYQVNILLSIRAPLAADSA